ncbi:MAG: hypothetical protein M3367_14885 [Acidobacteriota bacterium]|nr:hypothetical protein [Acidobacteriota bacterium]
MAENKQNSETGKMNPAMDSTKDNKTNPSSGAASTRQAKENASAPNKTESNQTESLTDDIVSQVGSALQGDTNAIKDTIGQAKESTGKVATQALGQAKDKAASVIDEQKTNIATGLTSVADGIRQVGENLRTDDQNQVAALAGKYGESLAGQVEKFSNYINQKEIKELARDVEQFARRNPALFIGGALALGILAARFLKSSGSSNQNSRRRSANNRLENSSMSRI